MISVANDKLYWHNTLRVFHTKCNMERTYDIINPDVKTLDIMLQAPINNNPRFLHAWVMKMFHMEVYKKKKAGLVTMKDAEKHSLYMVWGKGGTK